MRRQYEEVRINCLRRKAIDWGVVSGLLLHYRLSGHFLCGLNEEKLSKLHLEFYVYADISAAGIGLEEKVAERYVADQRFVLSKLKYSGGQRMLYVVIQTEQDEVRIIAIEGYNGDLMFMKAATRAEIGVAMGLVFDYNESMVIFG